MITTIIDNPFTGKRKELSEAEFNSYMAQTNGAVLEWIVESNFEKHAPGIYPSMEQYHFNDEIVEQSLDVHELPDDINCIFLFKESKNARFIHYTMRNDAKDFVEPHAEKYFSMVMSLGI